MRAAWASLARVCSCRCVSRRGVGGRLHRPLIASAGLVTASAVGLTEGAPAPSALVTASQSPLAPGAPGRYIIFGDVHGCAEELRELLDACEPRVGDVLISVGDLVAKGAYRPSVVAGGRSPTWASNESNQFPTTSPPIFPPPRP
jgi:hypothetical protein